MLVIIYYGNINISRTHACQKVLLFNLADFHKNTPKQINKKEEDESFLSFLWNEIIAFFFPKKVSF